MSAKTDREMFIELYQKIEYLQNKVVFLENCLKEKKEVNKINGIAYEVAPFYLNPNFKLPSIT